MTAWSLCWAVFGALSNVLSCSCSWDHKKERRRILHVASVPLPRWRYTLFVPFICLVSYIWMYVFYFHRWRTGKKMAFSIGKVVKHNNYPSCRWIPFSHAHSKENTWYQRAEWVIKTSHSDIKHLCSPQLAEYSWLLRSGPINMVCDSKPTHMVSYIKTLFIPEFGLKQEDMKDFVFLCTCPHKQTMYCQ